MNEALEKAQLARRAASEMARLDLATRNNALLAMADAIIDNANLILEENAKDMAAARLAGVEDALLDRLMLDQSRLVSIAKGLTEIASLPDPLGRVLRGGTLQSGLLMRQVSVPIGVVAMIYESRPNVTADVAGLCLKTANAVILRGGTLAFNSNQILTSVLTEAGVNVGLPINWLQSLESTDRSVTTDLMELHGLIDLLIPRGSGSLISAVVENSKVPVIETGEGNCHLYIHTAADPETIMPIVLNAKLQRPGVCNAIESLLIDNSVVDIYLPQIIEELTKAGVKIHGDQKTVMLAHSILQTGLDQISEATEKDWYTEYLGLEIAIRCVDGLDSAIDHINTYGTHHSDAILSQDYAAVQRFLAEVDSATVYANASTRFTDGGEFGLGAEIGISTQKLHARGPMGLEALTTGKYILEGTGQIR